ncbi:MAG: sugar transferase, partial [Microbacterium sp.]
MRVEHVRGNRWYADAAAPRTRRSARNWPARYAGWLRYSDAFVVIVTMAMCATLLLPSPTSALSWPGGPAIPYWVALTFAGLVWLIALAVFDTRERHIVGNGATEYRRVVNATMAVFAAIVIAAFFLRIEVSRALLLVAVPIGAILLVLSRWLWRQWLRRQQRSARYVYRTVVAAEKTKAAHVVTSVQRSPGSGFDVVGVATSSGDEATIAGIPVLGTLQDVVAAMDAADADTLIVAGADELDPDTMRHIGWAVAARDGNLVMAPTLTDVAGPRIHMRPAAGLPLVHVDFPELDGAKRFAKRTFDLVSAALLIIVGSPILLATAIAIRIDSPGPILYTQERIGRRGKPFPLVKFRSMVDGSDDQLASLLDLQGTGATPLFKVIGDPRITPVGRFIRKHSIDELPQLFNVLIGQMSLVGPRPQRPAEVALYDDAAHRRMLVKPGMSGLWQVSGRSALAWEDALRLDLYYVEN